MEPDQQPEPLATGWEPDVPPDDSAVRQFVLALASRLEEEAHLVGGATWRDEGAVVADTGSPVAFENGLVLLAPPGRDELEEMVGRAWSTISPDRPWVLYSAFPLPDLTEMGLTKMGHPPFMYRPPGGSRRPSPDELVIAPVDSSDALAEFGQVMVDGFGFEVPDPAGVFPQQFLGDGPTLWLGTVDGRPVAGAAANVAHGLTEVSMVASHPGARGKGYGEALTWEATLADPSLPAGLIASDDGQPTYRRMGYIPILRFTLWAAFS